VSISTPSCRRTSSTRSLLLPPRGVNSSAPRRLSQFMDQTKSTERDHPQAPSVCAWTGRPSPVNAPALKSATCIRPITAASARSRTPGRPEHRSYQFRSRPFARLSTNTAFVETLIAQGQGRPRHRRGDLSVGDGKRDVYPPVRSSQRPRSITAIASPMNSWCGRHGRRTWLTDSRRTRSDYMDVFTEAACVCCCGADCPFLENDDAKPRADGLEHAAFRPCLWYAPKRRSSGTGHGRRRGSRPSGAAIAARPHRRHRPDRRDSYRLSRATEDLDPTKSGVDIYRLMKYQRSNQVDLHQPASAW